jgi:hypothetical protein
MITSLPGMIGGNTCMTVNGRELFEAVRYSIGSYLAFVEERIEKLALVEDVDYAVSVDHIAVDYVFAVEAAQRVLKPLGDAAESVTCATPADPATEPVRVKRKVKTAKPGAAIVSPHSGCRVDPRQVEMEL